MSNIEMKTLTIGDNTYEFVDNKARENKIDKADIQQTTGESENLIMSQKAVTDAINSIDIVSDYNDLTNKPTLGTLAAKNKISGEDFEEEIMHEGSIIANTIHAEEIAMGEEDEIYICSDGMIVCEDLRSNNLRVFDNADRGWIDITSSNDNLYANGEVIATENYVDAQVDTKIASLVDSAPEALNTLGELAEALNNHEGAYDALLETVGKKVDKTTTVNGHALSSNVNVTKSDVGLGNVDNTSDINKPISTATQTALDAKAEITTEIIDTSAAYIRDIPSNALPYARINEIGGVTRKCTNLVNLPTAALSGTTAYRSVMLGDFELPAGTYTLSAKYTHTGELQGSLDVRQYGSIDKFLGASTISPNTSGTVINKFTVPDGVKGIRIYLYSNFTSTIGDTSVTLTDIMLNSGSTALPYEPYFSGLRSAPIYEAVSEGVNLFDASKAIDGTWADSNIQRSGNDLVFTYGTATTDFFAFSYWIDVEPNTDYFVSLKSTSIRWCYVYTDRLYGSSVSQLNPNKFFNSGNNSKLLIGFYSVASSRTGTSETISDIMINKGTTALPYRPYIKRTLSIPEVVRNLPDYGVGIPNTDYYNRVSWRYDEQTDKCVSEYERSAYAFTITGEKIIYSTNYKNTVNLALQEMLGLANMVIRGGFASGYENFVSASEIGQKDGIYLNYTSTIIITDSRFTDLDTAKEILNTNPIDCVVHISKNGEYTDYIEITDISDILPEDNLLDIEGNGTITMANEYGYDVPAKITYYESTNEVIGADTIVGDLVGTASRAISDSDGNNIIETYATQESVDKKIDVVEKSVDVDTAYIREVPSDVMANAVIDEIGGYTRKCTNLLNPDWRKTVTYEGVDFTTYADGRVTANGTATGDIFYSFADTSTSGNILKGGSTYYIGLGNEFDWVANKKVIAVGITKDGVTDYPVFGDAKAFTVPESYTTLAIRIRAYAGAVFDNETYYPMLAESDAAVPYEPYFKGLRSAATTEVVSEGVNLCSPFNIGYSIVDATGAVTEKSNAACTDFIPFYGATNLIWSGIDNSLYSCVYFYNAAKEYLGRSAAGPRTEFIITSQKPTINVTNAGGEVTYIRLWYGENVTLSGKIDLVKNAPSMLNEGTTALPYTPYIKHTLPVFSKVKSHDTWRISLGDVHDSIDWESLKYTQRVGMVDMGLLSWYYASNGAGRMQATNHGLNILTPSSQTTVVPLLCDKYNSSSASNVYGGKIAIAINNDGAIWVHDPQYTDAATFKAAMSGVMLYYELAEPVISTLPPEFEVLKDNGVGIPNTDYYNRIRWRYDELTGKQVREYVKQTPMIDISTLPWEYVGQYGFFAVNTSKIRRVGTPFMCDRYERISGRSDPEMLNAPNMSICTNNDDLGYWLNIKNTAYTDVTSFKTAMNGVMLVYVASTPEITDISDILPDDNLLEVEPNGHITFVNDFGYDVPATINYFKNDGDATGTETFMGNLIGTASRALSDASGNVIEETYAKKSEVQSLGVGDMLKSVYDTNGDGIVDKAATADSATKATSDANGNNIASTYLPKSGGTITGNLTVDGAFNSYSPIQRYYSQLIGNSSKTGTGWYRIYTNTAGNASGLGTCTFNLGRQYSSPQNEDYSFTVSVGFNGEIDITQLSGVTGGHLIKKIRVVYKPTATFYIDFYTEASSQAHGNKYFVYGTGYGTFQVPTLVEALDEGYSTYEFTTVNGCKSDKGFTGNLNGNAASATTVERNVTDNKDVNIWKVYSDNDGEYGFRLQYDASGSGNDNSLSLVADNQTGTEIVAVKMLQDGSTTMSGNLNVIKNASDAAIKVQGTNARIGLEVNGNSRGLWDSTGNKWMVCADSNGITLNGNANTATTATNVANGGEGASNVYRHIWFSDNDVETKRNYTDSFVYNPATDTIKATNFSGTATKATQDGSGNVITSTYATIDRLTELENAITSGLNEILVAQENIMGGDA